MENSVLSIKGLSYSYDGESKALDHVDLEIGAGEKIAVLGGNGAGKSTLFLCLNGVLRPDGGEIKLYGQVIQKKNLNELRKNVGIVFQDADSQIIAPTVLSEVSFGPMNLKLPKEQVKERTYRALEYMNLSGFAGRPPHYLSGGEKKRVTIADIIAMEPEVFIFDEPTTALDPVSQAMLKEVLLKLSEEGKTLILSTHDVDFAYRFAERVLVLWEGKVIADGTPVHVFGMEEVLKKSHLKRPVLYEVRNLLVQKGILKADCEYPRCSEELEKLL